MRVMDHNLTANEAHKFWQILCYYFPHLEVCASASNLSRPSLLSILEELERELWYEANPTFKGETK